MRTLTNKSAFLSDKVNDECEMDDQLNQEKSEDFLFIFHDSNQENQYSGQRENYPEYDINSNSYLNSFGYNSTDLDSYDNYQNNTIDHIKQVKNETPQDYYSFYKKQISDNVECKELTIEQNLSQQEQQIDYAKFMNEHKNYYVNTHDNTEFNQLIQNYIFNNYQSHSQLNYCVTQTSNFNQNSSQENHQPIEFNQTTSSEQCDQDRIQVKPKIDLNQMINQKSCQYPSYQNNIEQIQNNNTIKNNQQSLNIFKYSQLSSTNLQISSQSNLNTIKQIDNDLEKFFEQVVQQNVIPISCNYYQIYQDQQNIQKQIDSKENSQKQQNLNDKITSRNQKKISSTKPQKRLSTMTKLDDKKISKALKSNSSFQYEQQSNEQQSDEEQQFQEIDIKFKNNINRQENFNSSKFSHIQNSNKKNVVKNIMTAFKNFILEPIHHNYNPNDLDVALELYNNTKILKDNLCQMQTKFKRYIAPKNFNHYTVKLMIQHQNYSNVFKYFLSGPIQEWVQNSNISDTQSHKVMIDFLRECFDDINLIGYLKRHEKKKAHFQ